MRKPSLAAMPRQPRKEVRLSLRNRSASS